MPVNQIVQSTHNGRYVNDIMVYLCARVGLSCLSSRSAGIVNIMSA